jgi:predicted  nucleic acid-binding Zn-ribbon protein
MSGLSPSPPPIPPRPGPVPGPVPVPARNISPQLAALTNMANQIRQAIVSKNQINQRFSADLKNRLRALDALSTQIITKIRAIRNRANDFQRLFNEQVEQVAELNRQLQRANVVQADSVREIQRLNALLQQSQANIAQTQALREQIAQLQGQLQGSAAEIQNLTQGIEAANVIIGDALGQLNGAPNEVAELDGLLRQLEAHVNEISQEIDNVNLPAPGNPPKPPRPQPNPPPGPPPANLLPTSGGSRSIYGLKKRKTRTRRTKSCAKKTKRSKRS